VRHFGLHWTTTTCADLRIQLTRICKSNHSALTLFVYAKQTQQTAYHYMLIEVNIGMY
jgi:hypothetical protein